LSGGASVEIHSAVACLHHSSVLDDVQKKAAFDRLRVLSHGWREVLSSDTLRNRAEGLFDSYSLRAADSLQFGAALIWCQGRPARRRFISGDARLCEAASHAGFAVVRLGFLVS